MKVTPMFMAITYENVLGNAKIQNDECKLAVIPPPKEKLWVNKSVYGWQYFL